MILNCTNRKIATFNYFQFTHYSSKHVRYYVASFDGHKIFNVNWSKFRIN